MNNHLIKACFFIFLTITGSYAHAQNKKSIDSLIQRINNATNDSDKVDQLLLLGEEYYLNYVDSAMLYWKQAEVLSEKCNYLLGLSDVYNNLGYLFDYVGDLPISLQYYQKAATIDKKLETIQPWPPPSPI